jgi:glycerol-3-phosphate dehydrogenase (NAD(P)+)
MRISVIGGGSWGTTLANLLAKKGERVSLWVREQDLMAEMRSSRTNTWYLPGLRLHEGLEIVSDLGQAAQAEVFVFAVPTQFLRSILMHMRPLMPKKPVIICANKGIEVERLCTISEIVHQELGTLKPVFGMLSGPSFAKEVAEEMPTAVVLGCADKKHGKDMQHLLSTEYFRVYCSTDVRGVELGGAVKNIIAIAAGISDGLGFGSNSRAALITRGLAEMSRLGAAMNAQPQTFMGLSGMGDLVLTCTGELSRNRQVGLRLGKGQKLMDILAEMKMVAEGVKTTEAVHGLSRKLRQELPITEQVYQVLYKDKQPKEAVRELMARELKSE